MTTETALSLFATPIGRCGIAWGPHGVLALQLPEAGDDATRARLRRRLPGAREASPPPDVRRAIERVAALLQGERDDLSSVPLDMGRVPAFQRQVYEAARAILPGATLSYGRLAARVGQPDEAQAVGKALGRNPFAIIVPCHRVLAADGRPGGFSAAGGMATKLRLLAIERARWGSAPGLFDELEAAGDLAPAGDPSAERRDAG